MSMVYNPDFLWSEVRLYFRRNIIIIIIIIIIMIIIKFMAQQVIEGLLITAGLTSILSEDRGERSFSSYEKKKNIYIYWRHEKDTRICILCPK